jgi:hypothetical protein
MLDPKLPSTCFLTDNILTTELIAGFSKFSIGENSCGDSQNRLYANQRISLGLKLPKRALAKFNALIVDIENFSTGYVLVGINLKHSKPDSDPSTLNTSFTGGREILPESQRARLLFPVESFGFYGGSVAWETAEYLEIFVCRDRDQVTSDPMFIRFHDLWGQSCERPRGPRLQSSGLSKVLSRDIEGLTSFHPGVDAMPFFYSNICNANLSRPFGLNDMGSLIPAPYPYPPDSAQNVLNGSIMGQRFVGKIDWRHNPYHAHEWTHFLNRHHFLRSVALEAATTGAIELVSFLERTLRDWIQSNPAPLGSNGGAGPTWETLTVAWRLREWFWVMGLVWDHKSFSDDARRLMLRSVWEHARSLMDHRGHPNNWIIIESAALAITGLLFRHFSEAGEWFKTGTDRVFSQIEIQFYPDGSHFEISPLYHSICLNALFELRKVAEFSGMTISEKIDSHLFRMFRFLGSLKRPNGTWPSINDSGSATGDYSTLIKAAGSLIDRTPTGLNKRMKKETDPPPRLEHYYDSGIVTMGAGHPGCENFLIFRCGPAGAAHVHNDNLSVDVCFNGHLGLVDPGISQYAPGALSDYYRSARSHNSVLVDDMAPERSKLSYRNRIAPAGNSLMVEHTDNLLMAFGMNQSAGTNHCANFHLSRTIIFVKGQYWIIRDFIHGQGCHNISTVWKCFPSDVNLTGSSLTVSISNADGLDFRIAPIFNGSGMGLSVVKGSMAPARGWTSINGKDVPAPSIVYTVYSELPIISYWGLFPKASSGDFPDETKMAQRSDGGASIAIVFPDGLSQRLEIGPLEKKGFETDQVRLCDEIFMHE